jgi:hypothetical protein
MAKRIHYPLTSLMQEARQEAPRGITYALKTAKFPECDTPPGQPVRGDSTADLYMLNAKPEDYVLGRDTLAGGLAIAYAQMEVDEYERVDARVRWYKQAVRLSGLVMPSHVHLPAVAVYVPGEPSTGFVHFADRQQAAPLMAEHFGVPAQAAQAS